MEQTLRVYRNIRLENSHTIGVYMGHGGYEGLRKVVTSMSPDEVIEQVKASGLRGRGGACFPTGVKWSFVPKDIPGPRYVVCNADESEPGTFKDRALLENDPHLVLEGMAIAGYAIGARRGFVYVRGEYAEQARIVSQAVSEANQVGVLGDRVLGSDFCFHVTVFRGAGAYICGEETALLESIEGKRGYPRYRPPFPASKGLFGRPTVINNVETLANVPLIIRHGVDWYRSVGTPKHPGTLGVSISGQVNRPGLYELPAGMPLRAILEECAGGMRDGYGLRAVIPGGSSSPWLPTDKLDTPLDAESIAAAGSAIGCAATIFIDDQISLLDVLISLVRFYHHESCGECTPCREGTRWLILVLERMQRGEGRSGDLELLQGVCNRIHGNTLCALGETAVTPVESALKYFREDMESYLKPRPAAVAVTVGTGDNVDEADDNADADDRRTDDRGS